MGQSFQMTVQKKFYIVLSDISDILILITKQYLYIHLQEPWKIAKIEDKNLEKQGKKGWKNLENLEIWEI